MIIRTAAGVAKGKKNQKASRVCDHDLILLHNVRGNTATTSELPFSEGEQGSGLGQLANVQVEAIEGVPVQTSGED